MVLPIRVLTKICIDIFNLAKRRELGENENEKQKKESSWKRHLEKLGWEFELICD
jgi:hypothetical protein